MHVCIVFIYVYVYFYGYCNHFVSKKKSMKPTIGHGNPWPEQATVAWTWKDDSSSEISGNDDSKANDPMKILVLFSTVLLCSIFTPDPCGNDAIWLSYFSDGLKAPSRKFSGKRVRIQGANGTTNVFEYPPWLAGKFTSFFLLEIHRLKWLFLHSHTIVLYGIFTYIYHKSQPSM